MRIGIMIGPETRRYAAKVHQMVDDARAADEAGFATGWIPQRTLDDILRDVLDAQKN